MAIQPLAAIHELLESYAGILGKLKMHESPENTKASKGPRSVPDCYKAWVTKLIKPYFAENGFNNKENDTEEERELKDKMKEFACEDLKYEECLNHNQGHEAAAGRLAEEEDPGWDAAGYKDVAKCYKNYQARARSAQARRACALRALGLLLADGTPTVGGGKTF